MRATFKQTTWSRGQVQQRIDEAFNILFEEILKEMYKARFKRIGVDNNVVYTGM